VSVICDSTPQQNAEMVKGDCAGMPKMTGNEGLNDLAI